MLPLNGRQTLTVELGGKTREAPRTTSLSASWERRTSGSQVYLLFSFCPRIEIVGLIRISTRSYILKKKLTMKEKKIG